MKSTDLKNMALEENRLETFQRWIYKYDENVSCSGGKMAKAGFFMDCPEDTTSAKCFCCMKTLNGWEKNDVPLEEHIKHSPKCLFVKTGKEESDMTICEMMQIAEEMDTNLLKLEYLENIKMLERLRKEIIKALIEREK